MALVNPNPHTNMHVVFLLKRQPPINFNLVLRSHAMEHGLTVHNVGFHPHLEGSRMSVHFTGGLANAKTFAESAMRKFGAYIAKAEVGASNQPIFKR